MCRSSMSIRATTVPHSSRELIAAWRKRSALSANRTRKAMCATGQRLDGGARQRCRLKDEFGARQVRVRGHSKRAVPPDVRGPGVDPVDQLRALGELEMASDFVARHIPPVNTKLFAGR